MVRPGGTVVYIGLHDESSPLAANYLVRQEINIRGSFAYTPGTLHRPSRCSPRASSSPRSSGLKQACASGGISAFAGLVDGSIVTPKIILRPA